MALENGNILRDRYRIEETIAKGGMGAIYRAVDESLGVVVAVKENLFSNEDYSRQFHREASILAGLRHPNLPRVTDHFVIQGQGQYLVMDYIDGEDLHQRILRVGAVPEEDAILITTAICDALNYLHHCQPPIVHRDIKPGNIKITPGGQVYLVDFGLAKVSQAGQATTIGAQALTPGYAPPEQYGKGTEPRSDIYSLGATLYAAMTGIIPEDALTRAMGSARLTPPRQHNPKISDRTSEVIEKAMAVEPSQRYQSGAEFKSALLNANTAARKKISQMNEVRVPPPPSGAMATVVSSGQAGSGAGGRPPQFVASSSSDTRPRRKRWLLPVVLIAAGLGVVILGVIGVVAGWQLFSSGQPVQTPVDETQSVVVLPGPAKSPTALGILATLKPQNSPPATKEVSPSPVATGTSARTPIGGGNGEVAFSSDRGGSIQIWKMDVDGNNPVQITNIPEGACQPEWSPDGNRLVFISPCSGKQEIYKGSSLFFINADGTGLEPLPSLPGGDFDPAWSPDGNQIAFASVREGNTHLFILNLRDNSVVGLSNPSNFDRQPAWSPDGKTLAFTSTRLGAPQTWTMNTLGQEAKEFSILSAGAANYPVWAPDMSVIVFSQTNTMRLVAKKYPDRFASEIPISEKVIYAASPRFSKDGRWLVFESWMDGVHSIYRITRNGTNLTRLTKDPGMNFQPAWRP